MQQTMHSVSLASDTHRTTHELGILGLIHATIGHLDDQVRELGVNARQLLVVVLYSVQQ